jgi:hypothetical protein
MTIKRGARPPSVIARHTTSLSLRGAPTVARRSRSKLEHEIPRFTRNKLRKLPRPTEIATPSARNGTSPLLSLRGTPPLLSLRGAAATKQTLTPHRDCHASLAMTIKGGNGTTSLFIARHVLPLSLRGTPPSVIARHASAEAISELKSQCRNYQPSDYPTLAGASHTRRETARNEPTP